MDMKELRNQLLDGAMRGAFSTDPKVRELFIMSRMNRTLAANRYAEPRILPKDVVGYIAERKLDGTLVEIEPGLYALKVMYHPSCGDHD